MRKMLFVTLVAMTVNIPISSRSADVHIGETLSVPEAPNSFVLYNTEALARQQRHLALRESLARIDQNNRYSRREVCRAGVQLERAIDQHKFFGNLPSENQARFDRRLTTCGEG